MAFFVLFLSVCALGCGGERLAPVAGRVTVNGEPLANGYIAFYRQAKTEAGGAANSKGSTSGAEISAGAFRIPPETGLAPGKYIVVITASRPTGRKVADDYTGGMADVQEQFLPAKYNANSALTAEIPPGGDDSLEYHLEL